MPVKTTSKQTHDLLVEDTIQPTKVTPLILYKKLEDDLGIDFSAYEKFKNYTALWYVKCHYLKNMLDMLS